MYKSYFLELGGFDLGLKMYGGENFELSLKVNIAVVIKYNNHNYFLQSAHYNNLSMRFSFG